MKSPETELSQFQSLLALFQLPPEHADASHDASAGETKMDTTSPEATSSFPPVLLALSPASPPTPVLSAEDDADWFGWELPHAVAKPRPTSTNHGNRDLLGIRGGI